MFSKSSYYIDCKKRSRFDYFVVYMNYRCLSIIEYGSTLYVGMTQEKNGGPIKCVQNLMSELCSGCSQKLL